MDANQVTDCCATTPAPETAKPDARSTLETYYPLILITGYLLVVIGVIEAASGAPSVTRAMTHFMSGFFLVFSFFKLLSLRGFVDAYRTYDIVAKHVPAYAWVYPFIELGLGLSYAWGQNLPVTNVITLVVMAVSSVGVIQSIARKTKIQCACLGTIFDLPMTKVTLFEDLAMAAMALAMLL